MPDAPDPMALLTATQCAAYAGVSVQAIVNWRNRGHLPVAGTCGGRRVYRLLDVAKAERKTRTKARRR